MTWDEKVYSNPSTFDPARFLPKPPRPRGTISCRTFWVRTEVHWLHNSSLQNSSCTLQNMPWTLFRRQQSLDRDSYSISPAFYLQNGGQWWQRNHTGYWSWDWNNKASFFFPPLVISCFTDIRHISSHPKHFPCTIEPRSPERASLIAQMADSH